ncbi:hypothetical protein BYT27DRAFT_7161973 [Phlegmacium glaucopus]|nr:hypothetical protein BYT27DRAFT_7161973 [Phlegmacium glaucopus]
MPDQVSFPEDAERLPEGFKRIAYDSDSMKFTFRDSNGQLYQGEAGSDYGTLRPMSASTTSLSRSRPNAFASESSSIPTPRRPQQKQKSTFQDILPPNLITTSSLSERNPESPRKIGSGAVPREQFVNAVRRTVLPKMQGVVHNLRRSVTSIRGKRPTPQLDRDKERNIERDETRGLVRSDSLTSASSGGTDIRRSVTSHPRSKHLPG